MAAAEPARTFVDTNVLLYSFDTSEPRKREIALELLTAEDQLLVLSAQVLSEFYVNAVRKLAEPLPESEASAAVADLTELPTVAIDAELVRDAIELSREAQVSYWDALIVAAARAAHCTRILTEDLNSGQVIGGVRIEDPFAT